MEYVPHEFIHRVLEIQSLNDHRSCYRFSLKEASEVFPQPWRLAAQRLHENQVLYILAIFARGPDKFQFTLRKRSHKDGNEFTHTPLSLEQILDLDPLYSIFKEIEISDVAPYDLEPATPISKADLDKRLIPFVTSLTGRSVLQYNVCRSATWDIQSCVARLMDEGSIVELIIRGEALGSAKFLTQHLSNVEATHTTVMGHWRDQELVANLVQLAKAAGMSIRWKRPYNPFD